MELKHLSLILCLLFCTIQLSQATRSWTRSPTTRSWRESLESFENDTEDMIETFTPTNAAGPTVCMSKKRYDNQLRVIERMKDYMKTVEAYMETCSRLSDAVRDRNSG